MNLKTGLFSLLALCVALTTASAQTVKTPIRNGFLQTNLDAAGYDIVNLDQEFWNSYASMITAAGVGNPSALYYAGSTFVNIPMGSDQIAILRPVSTQSHVNVGMQSKGVGSVILRDATNALALTLDPNASNIYLTGQTLAQAGSVLTRGLGDARYPILTGGTGTLDISGYNVVLPSLIDASIQIRRGIKSDLAGVVLASGELAWTTDTHELFIGDGSTPGGVLPGGATGTASTKTLWVAQGATDGEVGKPTKPFGTLGQAQSSASEGDLIIVMPGDYDVEFDYVGASGVTIWCQPGVTITSSDNGSDRLFAPGYNVTILGYGQFVMNSDYGGSYAVYLDNDYDLRVEGESLTVVGTVVYDAYSYGGATSLKFNRIYARKLVENTGSGYSPVRIEADTITHAASSSADTAIFWNVGGPLEILFNKYIETGSVQSALNEVGNSNVKIVNTNPRGEFSTFHKGFSVAASDLTLSGNFTIASGPAVNIDIDAMTLRLANGTTLNTGGTYSITSEDIYEISVWVQGAAYSNKPVHGNVVLSHGTLTIE